MACPALAVARGACIRRGAAAGRETHRLACPAALECRDDVLATSVTADDPAAAGQAAMSRRRPRRRRSWSVRPASTARCRRAIADHMARSAREAPQAFHRA